MSKEEENALNKPEKKEDGKFLSLKTFVISLSLSSNRPSPSTSVLLMLYQLLAG